VFDIHQEITRHGEPDERKVQDYIDGLMKEFAASPEAQPLVDQVKGLPVSITEKITISPMRSIQEDAPGRAGAWRVPCPALLGGWWPGGGSFLCRGG
jgi:hypothetical protein